MVCKSLERKQYDHVLNEYFEQFVGMVGFTGPDGRRITGMEAFFEWFKRQMQMLFRYEGNRNPDVSQERLQELQACYNYLKENYSPFIIRDREETLELEAQEEWER